MQKVLITGAASGLGRAMAIRFAKAGADICIADLNLDEAEKTLTLVQQAGGQGWCYKLDVSQQEEWQTLLSKVEQHWGSIDVVINNAGVATGDRIDQGSWDDWQWVMNINLNGVIFGCRTFTPMMKQQGHGYFINTASLAGLMKAPLMSSYNVSKAAVVALSETMHYELQPYGIGTTALCPGFFRTNLDKSLRSSDPNTHKFVDKVFASSELDADDVADAAYQAMLKKKKICNPHKVGRQGYFVKKYLPWLFDKMMLKMAIKLKQYDPELNDHS